MASAAIGGYLLFGALVGCGTSARTQGALDVGPTGGNPAESTPSDAFGTPKAVFEPGDLVGYVVRDGDGRVVGRLHSKYVEDDDQRTVVSRAAYGRPAVDLARLATDRTVERATTLSSDGTIRQLKVLSSVDGLHTYLYEDSKIKHAGPRQTRQVPNADPTAVPVFPDDPALLALMIESWALEPGDSARHSVRAGEPVAVKTWVVQAFADADRAKVVHFPWGEATLDPRGRIDQLRTKDGWVYERLDAPGTPPRLVKPPEPLQYERPPTARWVDRAVRVDVSEGTLAGVLSAPPRGGPGVVLFSDLGPQDRFGFGRGIDHATWAVHDRLAEEGFAVLRLDDRGVGASESGVARLAVGDRLAVEDAGAVVSFMRRQPEVFSDAIFVIGHGFGAYEAVAVAAQEDLRGVVLLAPPARAPAQVLAERWVTEEGGDVAARRATLEAAFRRWREHPEPDLAPSGWPVVLGEAVARNASRAPLVKLVTTFDEPVAVVQGMNDFEVSWRSDAQALVRAINGRRGKRAQLFIYEYVDHLLKTANRPSSPERYEDRYRKVDRKVLDDLVRWLKAHVDPAEPS